MNSHGGAAAAGRWLRRGVIAPLWLVLVLAAAVAVAPLIVLCVLLVPVLSARLRDTVRMLLVGYAFLVFYECGMLLGCFGLWLASGFGGRVGEPGFVRLHDLLNTMLVATTCRAGLWLARYRLAIDLPVALDESRRVLVLARHIGGFNSVLVPYALTRLLGRPVRAVANRRLGIDPGFDILFDRLGACFIRSGSLSAISQIESWFGRGTPDHAYLLFPEGTSHTRRRRLDTLARLRERHLDRRAERAEQLMNVLPPSTAGVRAALAAMPDADVVILAHTGLAPLSDAVDHHGDGDTVRISCWHVAAAEVPKNGYEQDEWLYGWWSRIDSWAQQPCESNK